MECRGVKAKQERDKASQLAKRTFIVHGPLGNAEDFPSLDVCQEHDPGQLTSESPLNH